MIIGKTLNKYPAGFYLLTPFLSFIISFVFQGRHIIGSLGMNPSSSRGRLNSLYHRKSLFFHKTDFFSAVFKEMVGGTPLFQDL